MSDATQWAIVWKIKLYFEKEIEMLLQKKWGKYVFFSSKSHWFQLLRKTVYPNYLYLLYFFPFFCPMSPMCTMQSVTTEKLLSIAFWIIKKTLLVVLCYNSIAQNYYRIWQGRRLIKRCRYTFSHQISMLPLPKNMKNDFSAALPPMQYNA